MASTIPEQPIHPPSGSAEGFIPTTQDDLIPSKPLDPAQALQSPVHLDELWAEIQTLHEKLNNFIASHKACCVHHSNSPSQLSEANSGEPHGQSPLPTSSSTILKDHQENS
ncbi:hypothetical protein EDD15DRAFT_2367610 [Pisolithus albus]|nr:hypothetical protein EDD15DRAFT_2367610 [Pisolithus albus]